MAMWRKSKLQHFLNSSIHNKLFQCIALVVGIYKLQGILAARGFVTRDFAAHGFSLGHKSLYLTVDFLQLAVLFWHTFKLFVSNVFQYFQKLLTWRRRCRMLVKIC